MFFLWLITEKNYILNTVIYTSLKSYIINLHLLLKKLCSIEPNQYKRPLVNIVILVIVFTNFQQKIQTHKKGKGRIHQCSQSFQSRSWFGLSISL